MKHTINKIIRSETLENAPLQYVPQNELGVVFLFSQIASKLRIKVEQLKPKYPDCIAYQKTAHGEKRIRIEFEYKSSSFKTHKHNKKDCDFIVCWEHDWPNIPDNLKVIELRKYYGKGFSVWIQPAIKDQQYNLDDYKELSWGLSKRTSKGDLLLMYRCTPVKAIKDIFVLASGLKRRKAGWRDGECYAGDIKLLCKLDGPIFLEDFKNHRILSTSSILRRNFQGNINATEYWPYLYEIIIKRNPSLKKTLEKYSPENL